MSSTRLPHSDSASAERDTETYYRTVKLPSLELTQQKHKQITRVFEQYAKARELASERFQRTNPVYLSGSDREEIRKEISSDDRISLPGRTIRRAVETIARNYETAAKNTQAPVPNITERGFVALDPQVTRIFAVDNTYYLNVNTGTGNVSIPLKTPGQYHERVLPDPDSLPVKRAPNQVRPGTPLNKLTEETPDGVAGYKASTLHQHDGREVTTHLTVEYVRPKTTVQKADNARFRVGISLRGPTIATAAIYDAVTDHIYDWKTLTGDTEESVWRQKTTEGRKQKLTQSRIFATQVIDSVYEISQRYGDDSRPRFESEGVGIIVGTDGDTYWSNILGEIIEEVAQKHGIAFSEHEREVMVCSRCGGEMHVDDVHVTCADCDYTVSIAENHAALLAKNKE